MLTSLIAYNAQGEVVGTLDHRVIYDDSPQRNPLGLVDFEAYETAGGSLTDIWTVSDAEGSGSWPEWLDRPYDFKVQLRPGPKGGSPRIKALVHKGSGHKRERADIERVIEDRIAAIRSNFPPEAKDDPIPEPLLLEVLREVRGHPQKPKRLDEDGRDKGPEEPVKRPKLPLVAVGRP